MRYFGIFCLSCFYILTGHLCVAQDNRQLHNLHDFLMTNKPPGLDSTINDINYLPNGNLHYLYPIYQLFANEEKFKNAYGTSSFYNQLSEAVSFAGDYSSALAYQQMTYDSSQVNEVEQRQINKIMQGFKNIQHVDARKFISFLARDYQVIMINEAHNKPVHRAFTISLLEDLHKKGFRYLAMEMLNNYSN